MRSPIGAILLLVLEFMAEPSPSASRQVIPDGYVHSEARDESRMRNAHRCLPPLWVDRLASEKSQRARVLTDRGRSLITVHDPPAYVNW